MESQLSSTFAFFAATALFAVTASAQPSSSSCTPTFLSLSPCVNFISGSETVPPSTCCQQFASVVQSVPQCLCAVLSGSAASQLGITINLTRALELPSACKVQTPPVSQCNNIGGTNNTSSSEAGPAIGSRAEASALLILTLLFMALCSSVAPSIAS